MNIKQISKYVLIFSLLAISCKQAVVEEVAADGEAGQLNGLVDQTLIAFESTHPECDLSANLVGEVNFNFREYIEPNFVCNSSGYGKKVSAGAHMYLGGKKLDLAPVQIQLVFTNPLSPASKGSLSIDSLKIIRGGFGYPFESWEINGAECEVDVFNNQKFQSNVPFYANSYEIGLIIDCIGRGNPLGDVEGSVEIGPFKFYSSYKVVAE